MSWSDLPSPGPGGLRQIWPSAAPAPVCGSGGASQPAAAAAPVTPPPAPSRVTAAAADAGMFPWWATSPFQSAGSEQVPVVPTNQQQPQQQQRRDPGPSERDDVSHGNAAPSQLSPLMPHTSTDMDSSADSMAIGWAKDSSLPGGSSLSSAPLNDDSHAAHAQMQAQSPDQADLDEFMSLLDNLPAHNDTAASAVAPQVQASVSAPRVDHWVSENPSWQRPEKHLQEICMFRPQSDMKFNDMRVKGMRVNLQLRFDTSRSHTDSAPNSRSFGPGSKVEFSIRVAGASTRSYLRDQKPLELIVGKKPSPTKAGKKSSSTKAGKKSSPIYASKKLLRHVQSGDGIMLSESNRVIHVESSLGDDLHLQSAVELVLDLWPADVLGEESGHPDGVKFGLFQIVVQDLRVDGQQVEDVAQSQLFTIVVRGGWEVKTAEFVSEALLALAQRQ